MGNSQPKQAGNPENPQAAHLARLFDTLAGESEGELTCQQFEAGFSDKMGRDFTRLLFNYCIRLASAKALLRTQFVDAMTPVSNTLASQSTMEVMQLFHQIFSNGNDKGLSKEDASLLVSTCFRSLENEPDLNVQATLELFVSSLMGGQDFLTESALVDWLGCNAGGLFLGLQLQLGGILTNKIPEEIHTAPRLKDLSGTVTLSEGSLDPFTIWLLSCSLPRIFISSARDEGEATDVPCWTLLYKSREQGLSMNRFQHHAFGYRGPTVAILRLDEDMTFAVGSDVDWKDCPSAWGGANCVLLQMKPKWEILNGGSRMLYFHEKSRIARCGLFIGTDQENPIISIDEGLSQASVKLNRKVPRQFNIDIQSIEVWGCGSSKDAEAQKDMKKWEKQQAEKQRKVKLSAEQWEDNPDRNLLEFGGITTRHAERPDV